MVQTENRASRQIADRVGFVSFRKAVYRECDVLLFERCSG
jgi:hypothetical protein